MIFLITLLMMQINVNIEHPEKYLGKSINDLKQNIDFSKKENIISKETVIYEHNFEKNQILFLNEKCRRLSLKVNKEEMITSIFFSTQKKINENIFIELVQHYGKPTNMQKMGAIKKSEKIMTDLYHSTSMVAESVNCSFDENPIFITWDKPQYKILIKMDYIRNTSLITFETKD